MTTSLVPAKHSSILYSCSLVWLIDIVWVIYLDYTVLIDHSTLNTPEYTHSQNLIYFIVIADFILIAFVLITTPFLCKQTFFQRSCKLGNNYVTASKEYLVISTFMIFVVLHANHLVFIIFGFLVEPIHALAKLIEFITTVAYFVSIFNIIFHYHGNHKDGRKYQFLHYAKLAFKFDILLLVLFYVILYVFLLVLSWPDCNRTPMLDKIHFNIDTHLVGNNSAKFFQQMVWDSEPNHQNYF